MLFNGAAPVEKSNQTKVDVIVVRRAVWVAMGIILVLDDPLLDDGGGRHG